MQESLRNIIQSFTDLRPADAIPPDWEDLEILWNQLNIVYPQSVLEFGSGCSTILIGWWLKQTWGVTNYNFVSVETDLVWAARLPFIIPGTRIFIPSTRDIEKSVLPGDEFKAVRIHGIPLIVRPDLVYIDGPDVSHDDFKTTYSPQMQNAEVILIDGRLECRDALSTVLGMTVTELKQDPNDKHRSFSRLERRN